MSNTLKKVIFTGLFIVPFIPLFVSSSFFFPFITTKAFVWRVIVEVVFLAWALLAIMDPAYRPKKSWLLGLLTLFVVVVGLADIFGVSPSKSFWSNFERMEGYVALVHLWMFFLVIGSFFKEVDWKRWWNASLIASAIMVVYTIFQLLGVFEIHQGGVRIDGTLGNASYLAIYALTHFFIALWFMVRERSNRLLFWLYGVLALALVFVVYHTATRGAILGLLGGLLITAVLNVRNKENRLVRKFSMGVIFSMLVVVGLFFGLRNTDIVLGSPVLSRFSHISTEELRGGGRSFVWPMAIKGFKERPILGWGQENFSYVFSKHYDAQMFKLEPWFDRAHNIFLDWLVSAGLLGLLSYLSLYVFLIYYIWKEDDSNLSYVEKTVLMGLIFAYFFHNLFVFDNLISYIFFASLLAYFHSRRAEVPLWKMELPQGARVLPGGVLGLVILLALFKVNIAPMRANTNLIGALSSVGSPQAIEHFKKSYDTSRLGRLESVEQMAVHAANMLSSQALSVEEKNDFYRFSRSRVEETAKDFNDDARVQIIAGSFMSTTGYPREALVYLSRAEEIIPEKQLVYFEKGSAYILEEEFDQALREFATAYNLAPENHEAKIIYLIGSIYARDVSLEARLTAEIKEEVLVFDNRIITAYFEAGRKDKVIRILERRIELDPANTDTYRNFIEQVKNS